MRQALNIQLEVLGETTLTAETYSDVAATQNLLGMRR